MPDNGELAIVLRGDLGAILRFAAGKKNPDFLAEAEALDNLLSPGSLVAGGRNSRSLRSGSNNAKTSAAGPAEVSQLSLVAGASFHHHLRSQQVMMVAGSGHHTSANSILSFIAKLTKQIRQANGSRQAPALFAVTA